MAENETLQKKLDQVISEKNKCEEERKRSDAEIARLMKENIKLLEEKKSLISGKIYFLSIFQF